MAKNIKLQVVNHPEFNKVLVRVTEQSHLGLYFSSAEKAPIKKGYYSVKDTRKFVASNGIVLGSNLSPARDEDDTNTFWLRGRGPASKQDNCFYTTKEKLPKLIAAVKEYNAFFADRAPVARPSSDSCSFIVG